MARQTLKATQNFSKKDAINSRNGEALQNLENKSSFVCEKAAIISVPDEETGEEKEVGVFISDEGTCYTCISSTVIDVIEDVIDVLDEDGPCELRLLKRTSRNDREFLSITIL